MTFIRLRTRTPLSVILTVLATAACHDTTAPATAATSATVSPNGGVGSVLVVKPKKNTPVIQSVQLSTTQLELNNGIAATFTATISNPIGRGSRTYTDAYVQGELRQGDVAAATGGFGVRCNAGPNGVLPLGTCPVIGLTINTMVGVGSLVSGPADFALTLYSQSDAFPSVTVIVPVILGQALVTP
jgi:hypothetical protein